VVVEADPGATLRLGFREDQDRDELGAVLSEGRRVQEALRRHLDERDDAVLQRKLSPLLLRPETTSKELAAAVDREDAGSLLASLHAAVWDVLGRLNEIPLEPGLVIVNATPPRLRGERAPSAEVHALGNAGGRGAVLLEVRRPGRTLRLWDHARFPVRRLDIEEALAGRGLASTRPSDFVAGVFPGRGWQRAVETPFAIDTAAIDGREELLHSDGERAWTLHVLSGAIRLGAGRSSRPLGPGRSGLIPPGVELSIRAESPARVVRVCVV
jgi:hypothetical protein